jgi:hypothetical protein
LEAGKMALARFMAALLVVYLAWFTVCVFAVVGSLALLICFWGAADVVIVQFFEVYGGKF